MLSFIPYVGGAVSITLALLMSVLHYSGMGQLAAVGLVYGAVQVLEGFVIVPRVVGDKLGLPPVLVLLALMIGGDLFGFAGVMLALPAAAVARVFIAHGLRRYRASALYSASCMRAPASSACTRHGARAAAPQALRRKLRVPKIAARGASMSERIPVVLQDLDRAASVARTLEHAEALAALCLDVLGRQAEGRSLYAGAKFIKGRAKEHGVTRDEAETPLGNLLEMLERGPQSNLERALIAALFLRGFAASVRARPERAHGVVREARRALRLARAALAVSRVAAGRADARARRGRRRVHRARRARARRRRARQRSGGARAQCRAYLGAVAVEHSVGARRARTHRGPSPGQLERRAGDARARQAERAPAARVRGARPRRRVPARTAALVRALGERLRAAVLGVSRGHHRARLSPRDRARAARQRDPGAALDHAARARGAQQRAGARGRARAQRRPCHALSELAARGRRVLFALGIVLGGLFALDAARVGDRVLWFAAAAFVLTGSGLDLVLEVVVPGSRGRVVLDVDFGAPHGVRLTGVPLAEADHFLNELSQCLVTQGGRRAVA